MRFKANDAGFDQLRTSAAAKALIKPHADRVAENANSVASTTEPAVEYDYYKISDGTDEHRARYRVITSSIRAERHEAKTQALEKALGA